MQTHTKEKIIKEAKRIEEDSLYSSKAHFYAGQFWVNLHLWIGIPVAVLAAVAGASALSQFDNHNIIAGILALLVAALTAVTTFLDPNGKAAIHRDAGNNYNSLRNRARIFYEVKVGSVEDDSILVKELNKVDNKRNELNQKSPQIPRWAFKKAKKGIKEGEASYKIDN